MTSTRRRFRIPAEAHMFVVFVGLVATISVILHHDLGELRERAEATVAALAEACNVDLVDAKSAADAVRAAGDAAAPPQIIVRNFDGDEFAVQMLAGDDTLHAIDPTTSDVLCTVKTR